MSRVVEIVEFFLPLGTTDCGKVALLLCTGCPVVSRKSARGNGHPDLRLSEKGGRTVDPFGGPLEMCAQTGLELCAQQ